MIRPCATVLCCLLLAACSSSDEAEVAADSTTTAPPPTFADAATTAPTFAPAPETTATTETSDTTTSVLDAAPAPEFPEPQPGAITQLDQLAVAPEANGDSYNRDLFGGGWIDADDNGCDTRCEVLAEERRNDLPGLPGGGWLSIFDGYSTDDPSELDIDHVVALGEAWRSGASQWDGAQRIAFANDLDDPDPLVAVSASTNRSKSDRDPASWQPPNLDAWCPFATAWIDTKHRWALTADQTEVDALRNMLTTRGC